MPKFFVSPNQIDKTRALITGEDVSHISKVLRMRIGDELVICDGLGNDYFAVIDKLDKGVITAKINRHERCVAESKIEVILFQALPKQGKMEYIIQKNTELGVSKIIPFYSKRCVTKPSDKLMRWQRVAFEAAKQSGRGIIPEVCEVVSFIEAISQMLSLEKCFMLYEGEAEARLKDILNNNVFSQIGFMVGPEGGFEPSEALYAMEKGIPAVTLGKRILRTETAGAAVLPIVMYSQDEI